MVEAVAIYGYPATTISRLVAIARISKTDFYGVFSSKEECFWAAFEECLESFAQNVEARVAEARPGRGQISAVITALADTIEAEPEAVSLVLVDSLALGPAADDPRARSQERFEAMLRAGVKAAGGPAMRRPRAQGVVIGLRRLAYRAIRDSDAAGLRRGAPALTDWVLDFATAPPVDFKLDKQSVSVPPEPPTIGWDEPPASERSRAGLTPRERIMRACAQLMVEESDAIPSIPTVSARGGTSNQTLYEEFGGKEEAVLAAFDFLIEPTIQAVEAALAARAEDPEQRIGLAIAELRRRLSTEPLLGELAFRAMPRLGRSGLERVDVVMARIAEALERAAPGRKSVVERLRAEATVGGLWGIMRSTTAAKGGGRMPPIKGLLDFALIGLGVAGKN